MIFWLSHGGHHRGSLPPTGCVPTQAAYGFQLCSISTGWIPAQDTTQPHQPSMRWLKAVFSRLSVSGPLLPASDGLALPVLVDFVPTLFDGSNQYLSLGERVPDRLAGPLLRQHRRCIRLERF